MKPIYMNLDDKQHETLLNYCGKNNSNKTDFIRALCDALEGKDDAVISIADKNGVVILKGKDIKASSDDDSVLKLDYNIEYTKDNKDACTRIFEVLKRPEI